MKLYRVLSGVLGCAMLLLIMYWYWEFLAFMGFPDGGITDYDKALRILIIALNIEQCAAGAVFFGIAWKSSDAMLKKHVAIACAVQTIVWLQVYLAAVHLHGILDHGQGG